MRKLSLALLALATAIVITPAAMADTSFNYIFTDGSLEATGILTGTEVGTGVFDITSGTIDLTGTSFNGTGIFVPVQSDGNFSVGGGTILTFTPLPDTNLYLNADPQIDNNGAFTFDITSGYGAGNGLAIWSNGPDSYGGWGGSWNFVDTSGNGSFDASPTPEPSSLMLLGTGLFGLAMLAFRKKKEFTT